MECDIHHTLDHTYHNNDKYDANKTINGVNMKKLIMKIHNNEKIRWEQSFPSIYGEKKFTANNERNIMLALRELRFNSLTEIRHKADKMGLMHYISQNEHNGKWGLDKEITPEGGGIIAQADTYTECVKRAQYVYGINPIFIYGVGVDGW